MASSDPSGLARLAIGAFLILAAFPAPVVAQSNQQITICQATGSQANPWVFTTINARDLAEHVARGDFRANSIADCPGAEAAGSPTPSGAAGAVPATTTSTPVVAQPPPARAPQQAGIGGGGVSPLSNAVLAQVVNTATATPAAATRVPTPKAVTASATPTAQTRPDVAGAQATPEAQVSALPKSGGEPDRPLLVLILLGLIGAGAGLRLLGRSRRRA